MAWKDNYIQRSFSDSFVTEHKALHKLDDVSGLVDFRQLEKHMIGIYAGGRGRRSYHPLVMFKALLLGAWYKLSDPKLEEMLARDLMFKRFCGLSMSSEIPDHSTLSRFRAQLVNKNVWSTLLEEINRQLADHGLIIEHAQASIIDASLIKAAVNAPPKFSEDNTEQSSTKGDPDAAWFSKTNARGKTESTYGFKAHVTVEEDGFVQKLFLTPANVHESTQLQACLTNKETAVYADSAYKSAANDQLLSNKNITNNVIEKGYRNKPLLPEQKKLNGQKSCTRSIVERVFGIWTLWYGFDRARFLGIAKNQVQLALIAIGYNIKRGVTLIKEINQYSQKCST